MPNVATVLKAEIVRVARKEVRAEVDGLRRTVSQQRTAIASLRRLIQELQRSIKGRSRRSSGVEERPQSGAQHLRFRADGLAAHRKRLGLSAADFGRLLGVSGQSVYKWEAGEVRPRRSQLQAIAEVRKMGRREAAAKLQAPG